MTSQRDDMTSQPDDMTSAKCQQGAPTCDARERSEEKRLASKAGLIVKKTEPNSGILNR